MDSNEAPSQLQDVPDRPHRRFTKLDIVLIGGAPILAFVGSVIAAWGSVIGVLIAAASGLMLIHAQARRHSRTDEPRLGRYAYLSAVIVQVFVLVSSFTLFNDAPHSSAMITYGRPLLSAAVCVVFFVVLLWPRRWWRASGPVPSAESV